MILQLLSNSNPPLPTIDKSAQAENIWQVPKRSTLPPLTTLMAGTPEHTGMSQGPDVFTKIVCACVWQLRHKMGKYPSEGALRMRTEVRKKSQVANKKINMPPPLKYEECAVECLFVVR